MVLTVLESFNHILVLLPKLVQTRTELFGLGFVVDQLKSGTFDFIRLENSSLVGFKKELPDLELVLVQIKLKAILVRRLLGLLKVVQVRLYLHLVRLPHHVVIQNF